MGRRRRRPDVPPVVRQPVARRHPHRARPRVRHLGHLPRADRGDVGEASLVLRARPARDGAQPASGDAARPGGPDEVDRVVLRRGGRRVGMLRRELAGLPAHRRARRRVSRACRQRRPRVSGRRADEPAARAGARPDGARQLPRAAVDAPDRGDRLPALRRDLGTRAVPCDDPVPDARTPPPARRAHPGDCRPARSARPPRTRDRVLRLARRHVRLGARRARAQLLRARARVGRVSGAASPCSTCPDRRRAVSRRPPPRSRRRRCCGGRGRCPARRRLPAR
jgi:hypothetical protein